MRFSAAGLLLFAVVGSGTLGVPEAVAGKGGGGGAPVDGGTVYYGNSYGTPSTFSSMTSACCRLPCRNRVTGIPPIVVSSATCAA